MAGSWCSCHNEDIGQRKVVWRMPSRDASRKVAVHGGHHKSVNPGEDLDQHHDPHQEDQDEEQNQGQDRDRDPGSGSGPRGKAPVDEQDPDQGREAEGNSDQMI